MGKVVPLLSLGLIILVEGGMLGQQFMHNAGAPYKFIVKTSTQPMADAAPVIAETMDVLKKRVNLIVPCDFNEILSVAYMEGQRMEVIQSLQNYLTVQYHDDGEPGVRDVVASISLGSPAGLTLPRV
jgi:hypothetical protein